MHSSCHHHTESSSKSTEYKHARTRSKRDEDRGAGFRPVNFPLHPGRDSAEEVRLPSASSGSTSFSHETASHMDPFLKPLSKEEVKAQIDTAEANIRRLTSQIDELDRARSKERRALGRLWFMILPVGRLPTELLAEIFSLTVHSKPTRVVVDHPSPPFGPQHPVYQTLLLSHVCSSWRQIIAASPKLWATGLVDVRLDRRKIRQTHVDGLQMLLNHTSPLRISVALSHRTHIFGPIDYNPPFLAAIARILAPTVSRWKNLKTDEIFFEALKKASSAPFSSLESLDLQYDASRQITPIKAFLGSPHLRRLTVAPCSMANWHHNVLNNILWMPWGQLTFLNLVEPVPATCRSILLQCANIVTAELTTMEWDSAVIHAEVTMLPYLEKLQIDFLQYEDGHRVRRVDPFFAPLSLPALHTLILVFLDHVWPAQEFSAFQTRAPNIMHISLQYSSINAQELLTLLRLTPTLTTLTLLCCTRCITAEFLRTFSYDQTRPGPRQLVPRLQELDWQWQSIHRVDHEAFEDAIRSRWWADSMARLDATPLRKVTVRKSCLDTVPDGWMEDLVDQGLELNLVR